ncbi:PAS domain-containing protein [Rugamonas sp. DEMB1]|uniref:PAS domain-containing sensor histidine kinase n=1 Tax=Rugamonas sp. DEMB1 TaxID=3039386 RepID=UPI00244CF908|nr:PAS domain-containing protein [Rugamonas sp. DEMB1]WGG48723.1 PAS domain-containing protein [Rugamonas sp. DEMB1]
MKKWSIETWSLAGIAAVLALMAAMVGAVWHQSGLTAEADGRLQQARNRVLWLEQLQAQLYRTEMLSERQPDAAAGASRAAAVLTLQHQLEQGAPLAEGSDTMPPLLARLRQQLRAMNAGAPDGEHGLAGIGLQVIGMISAERAQRDRIRKQDRAEHARVRQGMIVLMLGLAALSSVILLRIRRQSLAGRQALSEANATLERRIGARTDELQQANDQLRREIEVRKAAQQAQARSDAQLQEIISMMPVALFIKDAESRIVLMNEACEKMWGVPFAELSGLRGDDHFPAEQMAGFLADDRAAFADRALLMREELMWDNTRQEDRNVQTYKKPLYDAAGQPLLLVAMCVDVTERKRAEEALQRTLQQLRALSDHQENIKEDERRRIALDIHDELGQNLLALKLDVSMLHARTGASHGHLHREAGRVLATLDASILSVRAIIDELHPSVLELGLCAAVDWQLRRLEQRSGLRCSLQLIDDSANCLLDQRQTSGIFRIVQTALSNISLFAGASAVQVSLNLRPQRLTIVITDDGAGEQPGERSQTAAFGLRAIGERVSAFGGELVVARRAGSGSSMSILLPGLEQQARPVEAMAAG